MTKISVAGEVKRVLFRKEEWGIALLTLETGDEEKIVGVGCGTLETGDRITVTGTEETHPRFGKQIAVERIVHGKPEAHIGVENWLRSLDDMDPQNIEVICNTWGQSPEKAFGQLLQVLGPLTIGGALLRWIKQDRFLNIVKFAAPFGPKGLGAILDVLQQLKTSGDISNGPGSFEEASDIFHKMWKENPYECLKPGPVFRCGHRFAQADKYLMREEVLPEDSLVRLRYLMDETLLRQGDTVLDIYNADALLKKNWNFDLFPDCVEGGHLPENVTAHGTYKGVVQHVSLEEAERTIEEKINELQKMAKHVFLETDEEINDFVEFDLNEDQLEAVKMAASSPISLVTGGAGVGKTTVMKALIRLLQNNNIPFDLAAPTNKAARRLSQQTEVAATSIHRLLECLPKKVPGKSGLTFQFARNADHPFTRTVVIIDEASMIDTKLMSAVFRALGEGCRIVLVGDHHQLPPIGDGEPFKDLINSNRIYKKELTKIMRTDPGQLLRNVTRIRERKIDDIEFDKHATWEFIDMEDAEDDDVRRKVVKIASKIFKDSGADPYSFQIITPRRRSHPLSVYELNNDFRDRNFPHERTRFARGEKGICTGRSDHHELLNGDVFIVNQVLPKKGREAQKMVIAPELVPVGGEPTVWARLADRSLEPAWAITVHKYQGCEADLIIFVITDSMGAFPNRNMIYTALTRAKKKVIVVGSKTAFLRSLAAEEIARDTGFSYGIRQIAAHPDHDDPQKPVPHFEEAEEELL